MAKQKKKVGPMYHLKAASASSGKCKTVIRKQGASKAVSVVPTSDDMLAMIARLEAKLNPHPNAVQVAS